MAHTRTWDAAYELDPADSDDRGEGAARIRNSRVDVRERIAKDHYMDIAGTDADHGEHSKVTLQAPISTPANVANKGFLYGKDASSKIELHWEDEDGNEIQVTAAGDFNIDRFGMISVNAPSGAASVSITGLAVDTPYTLEWCLSSSDTTDKIEATFNANTTTVYDHQSYTVEGKIITDEGGTLTYSWDGGENSIVLSGPLTRYHFGKLWFCSVPGDSEKVLYSGRGICADTSGGTLGRINVDGLTEQLGANLTSVQIAADSGNITGVIRLYAGVGPSS